MTSSRKPPQTLRQLASALEFDPVRHHHAGRPAGARLERVRFQGTAQTEQIGYALKLPTERRRDIPEVRSSQYTAVFYLFGKADVSPFFAIHNEEALEFPYTLRAGSGLERVFCQIRSRNLLFLGCNLAEWLSRFFFLLSNPERLFSDQRTKKEFLVGDGLRRSPGLSAFLDRFSQDPRCYPADAHAFVDELTRRWTERNPSAAVEAQSAAADRTIARSSCTKSRIRTSWAVEDAGRKAASYHGGACGRDDWRGSWRSCRAA